MPWWEAILDGLGVVAAVIGVCLLFLFARRRLLSRAGGTFECSVRLAALRSARSTAAASTRGWTLGLGRYSGDNLEWFRVFSFSPRPRRVFSRSLTVLGRRTPHGAEAFSLYSGHQVIDVALHDGGRVELAMSEVALTGFLAWTEAAPPGHERVST